MTYNDEMEKRQTRDGPGRPPLSVQEKLKRVSARIPPESAAIIIETAAQSKMKGGTLIRYLIETGLRTGVHLRFLNDSQVDKNPETA